MSVNEFPEITRVFFESFPVFGSTIVGVVSMALVLVDQARPIATLKMMS
jgi:hypothetical protein